MQNPVIIACRNIQEANQIKEICHLPSVLAYHESKEFIDKLSTTENALLVISSLTMDETAIGLITKASIISPSYAVIWANHAPQIQNVLRLYGSGAIHVLGPDEIDRLPQLIENIDDIIEELTIPPFFIDDEESTLKTPDVLQANHLHLTFLGAQAMMSCANAILNITASPSISMSCVANLSPWTHDQIIRNFNDYTLWKPLFEPKIVSGQVTFCPDLSTLSTLEPTTHHFVICHGHLSEEEEAFLSRLSPETRVFQACAEGYVDTQSNDAPSLPEKFWDFLISSTY